MKKQWGDEEFLSDKVRELGILVGHDAEFPLINKDGKFISAVGIVPGNKENPSRTKNGAVQQDNVAGEVNIPPSRSEKDFISYTNGVMEDLRSIISPKGLDLGFVSSAFYDSDQLESDAAKYAGCDADMNAYTWDYNPRVDLSGKDLRSFGGHIHMGWDNPDEDISGRYNVAVCGDIFIGLPSLVLDQDTLRRSLYGKAGAMRTKPYGCEYRSPSNFWTKSPSLIKWIYWAAVRCVIFKDDETLVNMDIQEVINSNNIKAAVDLIKSLKIPMPEGVNI